MSSRKAGVMVRYIREVFLVALATVVTPTLWANASDAVTSLGESGYVFAQVGQDMAVGKAAVERIVAGNVGKDILPSSEDETSSGVPFNTLNVNLDSTTPAPPPILLTDAEKAALVKTLEGVADMISFTAATPAVFDATIVRLMAPTTRVQPFAAVAMSEAAKKAEESQIGFGLGTRVNFSKKTNWGTEVLVFPTDGLSGFDSLGKVGDVRMITRLEIKF